MDNEFRLVETDFGPKLNGSIPTYSNFITITSPELKELLRIDSKGNVTAPDLESASEAGKVFVDSMRGYILKMLGEQK